MLSLKLDIDRILCTLTDCPERDIFRKVEPFEPPFNQITWVVTEGAKKLLKYYQIRISCTVVFRELEEDACLKKRRETWRS